MGGAMTISALSQKKIVRMETQAMFPYLVEITHVLDEKNEDGTTHKENVYRYANSGENIEFEGNVYQASYFKISPPQKSESEIKDATITISAVDQIWINKIRGSNQRSRIRFIAVIQYDENGRTFVEPLDDITFTLTDASWDESTIQWTMKHDVNSDIKMPCQKLTQSICPALF